MNRAGTPDGGRKKASAQGIKGTSKTPVESKAAKLKRPAAKAVKSALKKAKSAAGGLAEKIAKSVTSLTKKNPTQGAKGAESAKAAKPAKAPAKAAAKPAKTPEKESPVRAAAAKAEAAVKSVKKAAKKILAPANKAPAKAAAGKAAAKPKAPTKTAPAKAKPKAPPKSTAVAAPAGNTPVKPKPATRRLRPKSFAELETARSFGFPEETPELPESYGEDRLVLMTKDPEYLFAYWDVTPERLALAERAKRDNEDYREALRLTWTSADLLEDSFVLIPVALDAKRWYLRVPFSGLSYYVEIGWLGNQGHFISLLGSSNPSDAPESWSKTRQRLLESDAAALEYSVRLAQPLGASESGRPVATSKKRSAALRQYEGPGAQSSSDAAIRIPAATPEKRS